MMASAVRKIVSDTGTPLPRIASMPNAKAMSVAIGIPIPAAVSVP